MNSKKTKVLLSSIALAGIALGLVMTFYSPVAKAIESYAGYGPAPASSSSGVKSSSAQIPTLFPSKIEGYTYERFGTGRNAMGSDMAAKTIYLPSVAHRESSPHANVIRTVRTNIYIYNPRNDTAQNTIVSFYNKDGKEVQKFKIAQIKPNATYAVSTADIFNSGPRYYGTAVISSDQNLFASYTKINSQKDDTDGDIFGGEWSRGFGIEGIPAHWASYINQVSPVTYGKWGIKQHTVFVFNPSNVKIKISYTFCDEEEQTNACFNKTVSLNAKQTAKIHLNTAPVRRKLGNSATGKFVVHSSNANAKIVSVSEDRSIRGEYGSKGDYGRGRTFSYNGSTKLCLIGMSNDAYGMEKTGFGASAIGTQNANVNVKFYQVNGTEVKDAATNDVLASDHSYIRDTTWAGGGVGNDPVVSLPSGYFGTGVVESTNGQTMIGGVQDLADAGYWGDEAFGRGAIAVHCANKDLRTTSYISGLNNTETTSIALFNPTNQNQKIKVYLYNENGYRTKAVTLTVNPNQTAIVGVSANQSAAEIISLNGRGVAAVSLGFTM